jgi:hypothetical protein
MAGTDPFNAIDKMISLCDESGAAGSTGIAADS